MSASFIIDFSNFQNLPPGLRFELGQAFQNVRSDPGEATVRELWRLFPLAEPWVGREADLAKQGYALLDASLHHAVRRFGCAWLTLFPTEETAARLSELALAADTPEPVREQAAWSLGYRRAGSQPSEVAWSTEAAQLADRALLELARRATATGKLPFEDFPVALRSVQAPELFELVAEALPFLGGAIESFASPEFARILLERLAELPNAHQLRAMRLAAAVLGEEAVPQLLAKASEGGIAEHLELRFLALTFGGETQLGELEDAIAPLRSADTLRQRARWHLANPGVVPTVEGLQIARTIGLKPGQQRKAAAARSADAFAALTPFLRHAESYLYTLWAEMVNASGDPARARVLAAARPDVREDIASLYLQDLAQRGRTKQVVAAAQMLESVEEGAYWLALYGRPFLALELAATSRFNNPKVAIARILGLYRAGRPDLAFRVFREELPPGRVTSLDKLPTFPGDEEQWLLERRAAEDQATTALAKGMEAVLALARPAPADTESDSFSFATVAALERWLARPIDGSTVFLAGEFPGDTKQQHTEAIQARGGRLVDGPFPGTHYYVAGLTCPVTIIAQLERQGTRRIRSEELGLSW